MTDLEKFIELYKSIGIELVVYECSPNKNISPSGRIKHNEGRYEITIYNTTHEKLDGYLNFHTTILFDKDGNFLSQGFWE